MKNTSELKVRHLAIEPNPRRILRGADIRNDVNPVCLFQNRARKALEMALSIRAWNTTYMSPANPDLGGPTSSRTSPAQARTAPTRRTWSI
jgi:hypothetical protein